MKLVRPVLAVAAIGLVAFGLYRRTHPANGTPLEAGSNLVFQVHSIAVTNNLELGEFTIPAKSTHDIPITADETQMKNARLLGYYSASGSGVEVMVLDEDQYQRFKNGSTPSEYLYLSKSAPTGTIDAPIPHSGKYYLIFDNSAPGSTVNVKANVAVRGEMVRVEGPPAQEKPQKK